MQNRIGVFATSWRLPTALFVMSSLALWMVLGIRHGGDTLFYFEGARTLLQGEPLSGAAVTYAGYMAFVAVHLWFGLGDAAIVLSQFMLSALAMVALYDLGCRLAGRWAGLLAASLYAVNVDLGRFTFYILSDSTFTSGLVLTVYAAYRASMSVSRRWFVLAVLSALALVVIRLNGWLMLAVFLVFLALTRARWRPWVRWIVSAVVIPVAIFGLLHTVARSGSSGGLGPLLFEGRVIWGDPSSRLVMPPPGELSGTRPSDAVRYCARHPGSCARLVGSRIAVEAVHTRSFYSTKHNAAIWLTFPLLYFSAGFGCFSRRCAPLTSLSLSLIALQLGIVGLTGADWDGRFILTVFPLIMLYSGVGAVEAVQRWVPWALTSPRAWVLANRSGASP